MNNYIEFLALWHQIAIILAFAALGTGVLNYLIYKINYALKRTFKEKFDFASEKETKQCLRSHIFIATAIFFFNNTLEDETVALEQIWFFVRIFISICASVLYGYVAHLVLKFYCPGRLERKLKRLRYASRTNPENGNKMKLLSKEEEDAYLDEGVQTEENMLSTDYDVWIDDATGYTKVEKYKSNLGALECDRCGLHTLRLTKEEILTTPTEIQDGEILREYNCSYCRRIKKKNVILTKIIKDGSEASPLMAESLTGSSDASGIKTETYSVNGEMKEYDF